MADSDLDDVGVVDADVKEMMGIARDDVVECYRISSQYMDNSGWHDRLREAIGRYVKTAPAFVDQYIEAFVSHQHPKVRVMGADLVMDILERADLFDKALEWLEALADDNDEHTLKVVCEFLQEFIEEGSRELGIKQVLKLVKLFSKAKEKHASITGSSG